VDGKPQISGDLTESWSNQTSPSSPQRKAPRKLEDLPPRKRKPKAVQVVPVMPDPVVVPKSQPTISSEVAQALRFLLGKEDEGAHGVSSVASSRQGSKEKRGSMLGSAEKRGSLLGTRDRRASTRSSTLVPERRGSNLAPPSGRGSMSSVSVGSRRNSGSYPDAREGQGASPHRQPSRQSIDSDLASLSSGGSRRPSISERRNSGVSSRGRLGPLRRGAKFGAQVDFFAGPRVQKADSVISEAKSEAWLARELGIPIYVLQQSLAIFKKYCADYDGTNLFTVRFDMRNFAAVLCELTGVESTEQLDDRFVSEAFRQADFRKSGGVTCKEFALWFAAFGFSNYLCVTKEDLPYRYLARKLGINVLQLERYKEAFDRYDEDGSGAIDMDEFESLLHDYLKVPPGHHLSPERIAVLWRDADREGKGELDLEAFCLFCNHRFEKGPDSGVSFSDYYRSIRRIPTAPAFN